jgi:short-subunit dehydrogenase
MTARFAVVTGASTGIGFELARCCAEDGFDVLMVANEPCVAGAAAQLAAPGRTVTPLEADLSTDAGLEKLYATIGARPVDALLANAGIGLGQGFLDQDIERVKGVVTTNITGTLALVHRIGREMRLRKQGRILITGSIAGFVPGSYHAVYNASKAFLNSFALALRDELDDTGVSVTVLLPGVTESEFFRRAGTLNTKVARSDKSSARDVAEDGFRAMMNGNAMKISGLLNKVNVMIMRFLPATFLARQHRLWTKPGA